MNPKWMRLTCALLLCVAWRQAAAQSLDCLGPAPDAQPGTAEWTSRDAANIACAEQKLLDTAANPVIAGGTPYPLSDAFRRPQLHDGVRFRYSAATVPNRNGNELPVDIFRPCTQAECTQMPAGLHPHDGPYPTVLVVHGGASNRHLHWWATQALAEAGYMAIAFDVAERSGGDHATDAQDVLDWLFSAEFSFAADLNKARVGIAGHSQGASTASLLGQIDPRLVTLVAWDNLTALKAEWEDDIGVEPPADVQIRKPALGIGADYYFAPHPNPLPPEPPIYNGEGGRGRGFTPHFKDKGYQELRAAGVDTMLFMLRAGTHLDFTPTTASPSSRYGQAVASYLTLAWFDRYLRGLDNRALAEDAFSRLHEATSFDRSADIHEIGTGAVMIEGLSICDRMSFYYASRYSIRAPGSDTVLNSEDWRPECQQKQAAGGEDGATIDRRSGGAIDPVWLVMSLLLVLTKALHQRLSRERFAQSASSSAPRP